MCGPRVGTHRCRGASGTSAAQAPASAGRGPSEARLDTGPETVIAGLQNADVFFFSPDSVHPTFVSMKVEVSVNGATNPIVLDGGFELRNMEAQ